MFVFLIFVGLLMLLPFPSLTNSIHKDYLVKENTLPIKGLFVLFVFCTHCKQYISFPHYELNNLFTLFFSLMGQLVVTVFLFYSGYGIFESIKMNNEYSKSFFKNRFVPTFFKFCICVVLFLLLNLIKGTYYDLKTILLSFTGFSSIGNSNWYMFVTFVLYLGIIIIFNLFKDNKNISLTIFSLYSIGLVIFLYLFKEEWWYDTILCFPLGMWYSFYKNKIDYFLKNNLNYFIVFTCLIILFLVTRYLTRYFHLIYCIYAIMFTLIIILITMKIKFKSNVLSFFGVHVFSIYMLQRIPMIIFSGFEINPYINFFIIFVSTIILAIVMDKLFNKINTFIKDLY